MKQCLDVSQDSMLNELVDSCNEIQSLVYESSGKPVSHSQNGPLRWRESCDKMIAVPRDVVQFRVILETTDQADPADVFRVGILRRLPRHLMFDRIESVFVNGEAARPTNHSLHRTLDLDFHQIRSGSVVVITYSVRVDFNAETTRILVGDTQVTWNWVSRGRHLHAQPAHRPQRSKATASRAGKNVEASLKPV